MDKRTLVKSGASSFTIAVPIEWVRKNALEKGSEVAIDENELGDLLLRVPRERAFLPQSQHTIKINKENKDLLYWEIVRAYLHNYTTINLEGDNVLHDCAQVLQNLGAFIGLDVIERTKNVVVLKNFSAYDTESSPYSIMKKLDVGTRAMIAGLDPFFSRGFSQNDVLEMRSQHQYNKRIYLFALKLFSAIVDTPSLMRVFKTDYRQLMKEHIIANSLEQVSFHFSQIGSILLAIDNKKKNAAFIKDITSSLSKKYMNILTMPKSPASKELIELLKASEDMTSLWQHSLKELRNQALTEFVVHVMAINSLLDQLGLELIN